MQKYGVRTQIRICSTRLITCIRRVSRSSPDWTGSRTRKRVRSKTYPSNRGRRNTRSSHYIWKRELRLSIYLSIDRNRLTVTQDHSTRGSVSRYTEIIFAHSPKVKAKGNRYGLLFKRSSIYVRYDKSRIMTTYYGCFTLSSIIVVNKKLMKDLADILRAYISNLNLANTYLGD